MSRVDLARAWDGIEREETLRSATSRFSFRKLSKLCVRLAGKRVVLARRVCVIILHPMVKEGQPPGAAYINAFCVRYVRFSFFFQGGVFSP